MSTSLRCLQGVKAFPLGFGVCIRRVVRRAFEEVGVSFELVHAKPVNACGFKEV